MNLIKWFRKNNKKVMAVVVIIIMFGFIGGSYIQYISHRRTEQHRTVAYFLDNEKITNYDLYLAQRELQVLKMLRADMLFRNLGVPVFSQAQDLRPLLLAELLFSERRISPALIEHIKQIRRVVGCRISDKQINDIYRHSEAKNTYWLLLKKEAERVGVRISNKNLRDHLVKTIPRLFNGASYSQVVGELIKQQRVSEKEILTTFGKLMAVLEYAKMICSDEDVTIRQVMHNANWDNETIDVNFVRFDSALFTDTQDEPTQQEILTHFDKYKEFFAGTFSEENPYGFGYKLPDRVSLEYIAVKSDDIAEIVTAPTEEETEEFYQQNIKQFTEQVPSDPNDPNSPLIERTKSYAEVASDISEGFLQDKIDSEAERILQEAKALTEANFEDIDTELGDLSAEQFRQMVGDYKAVAEELSSKNKIKVYTGQTGLLSVDDIQADEYLGMLYIQPYGSAPVGLSRIVFAIDELGDSELGPFDVPEPRMYENIGPMRDMTRRIMVLVRVIIVEKASEPESIDQTYSKGTLKFEQIQEPMDTQDLYSIKEKVVEDLKELAAMNTAKSKAQEFIDQAVKDGWDSTIDKFNKIYEKKAKEHEGEPNILEAPEDIEESFRLQNLSSLARTPREVIDTLAFQCAGDPATQFTVDNAERQARFTNQLYSLIPQDSNTVDTVPFVMEFKPDMSWYCVKNISVRRLRQDQYERIKAMEVYKREFVQSHSLAAIHFNPDNIFKRMNFRPVQEVEAADANTPPEAEEDS